MFAPNKVDLVLDEFRIDYESVALIYSRSSRTAQGQYRSSWLCAPLHKRLAKGGELGLLFDRCLLRNYELFLNLLHRSLEYEPKKFTAISITKHYDVEMLLSKICTLKNLQQSKIICTRQH